MRESNCKRCFVCFHAPQQGLISGKGNKDKKQKLKQYTFIYQVNQQKYL